MYRKILLTLALALGLGLTPALALAQMPIGTLPPEMAEALAKEKPLAQADIDVYLKILPQMGSVMQDAAAVVKLYEGAGLGEVRFNYIAAKVGLGMALAAGATPQQLNLDQMPEVLRPTDAEVALVKKNQTELQKASREMTTKMQSAQ